MPPRPEAVRFPKRAVWTLAPTLLLLVACTPQQPPVDAPAGAAQAVGAQALATAVLRPPVAEQHTHELTAHGDTRIDPYFWLRDDTREGREVLTHLEAENAYTEAVLAPTDELQERLFEEIVGRIERDDSSPPVREGGYWYYTRYEEGKEYPIVARKRDLEAPEEVLVDANERAAGHDFYSLGNWEVSSDEGLLAFAEDTVGRQRFTIRVKDLATGELFPDTLTNVEASLAWANDSRTLFYIEKHPQTLLGYRVRRHVLGTDPAADPLVWEETDSTFYTGVGKSRSDRFVYIYSSSTLSSEQRYLDADDPEGDFQLILPREADHEYDAEDLGDRFLIRTNWQAENFRIVEVPIAASADKSAWRDVVPHRDHVFVHGSRAFDDFLAVSERSGGLRKIRIKPWQGGEEQLLAFEEPSYVALLAGNPEQDTTRLRFLYTSLTTPMSTYEIDVATGERELLKRDPVRGGYDAAGYVTEYVHATARDGTKIPVSLVHGKGFRKDGSAPLYQYGYGSYGSTQEPWFNSARLSLLDRGFVYAIAHVRGGQEMGRHWYEQGKLLHKKNTFTDFVDVTRFLVAEGYADPENVYAMGASAGGLLMGAVANMAPELYRGIVAHVPWVDVVTTMFDDSIPLTSNEYDEWGDPRKEEYYRYMLSYSPYDQVTAQAYPAMLVTTGLWDSQVQYWEPAKWVAKLRAANTGDAPVLLRVNMDAGHGGRSGRFRRHHQTALEYAFLIDLAGVAEVLPAG